MKHIFLFLLLSVFGFSIAFAQRDNTGVKVKSQSGTTVTDFFKQDKNSRRLKPTVPDLKDFENDNVTFEDDEVTVSFDKPEKKTVFNSSYSRFIIPSAFLSYGILTRTNKALRQLDLSTNHEVGEHLSKQIHYDDYMQYSPAVAIYGLDFAGIKATHNFRDRTLIMATSYLTMSMAVQTMKIGTKIERPDKSNRHSFPSGHTATAFVGAHILFKEYKDISPWIGVGGYAVATATGTMRVLNKKHWASDIVAGAGIGILSAEIGYILLPVWHKILGISDNKNIPIVIPVAGIGSYGVGLAYRF